VSLLGDTLITLAGLGILIAFYVGLGMLADHLPDRAVVVVGGAALFGLILLIAWLELRRDWRQS